MSANQPASLQETFWTVDEIAMRFHKSRSWVYREFRNFPGVLRIGKRRPGKRPYVTLLIPEIVLQRWVQEHTAPGPIKETPLQGITIRA
jgi:hypothetical protein